MTVALAAIMGGLVCAGPAHATEVWRGESPVAGGVSPEFSVAPALSVLNPLVLGVAPPLYIGEPVRATIDVPSDSAPITVSDQLLLTTSGRCQTVVPLRSGRCHHPANVALLGWVLGSPLADRVTLRNRDVSAYVTIITGGGDDVVDARGLGAVRCGGGNDIVIVSAAMVVWPDCERRTVV